MIARRIDLRPFKNWNDFVTTTDGKSIWHLDKIVMHVAERLHGAIDIYLFGSRAYNTGSLRSDIDLLVHAPMNVDLASALTIQDDFPPLDIFRTYDLNFAESLVNSSRITARENGTLVAELHAIHLWNSDRGLSDYAHWDQATRVDIRFLRTIAELPRSFATKVFIGHGGAADWEELRTFLTVGLKLECDAFEAQPVAGTTTQVRLETMLRDARFAFLVATSEDEDAAKGLHARENVIHEIGLFQGRLGFEKAIILLEHGCHEFSNIAGLGQIRFHRGRIRDKFPEVLEVLRRERIAV